MKTKIIEVTPLMATQWLNDYSHPNNRKLSSVKVSQYREEMNKGKWQMNGETICFDVDGVLLNGHHRLAALSGASTSIQMLIVSGIASESFTTFDTGIKRNGSHVLQIGGIANANSMAALITAKIMYKNAIVRGGSFNSYNRPTNTDLLEEYKLHSDLYETSLKMVKKIKPLCPSSLCGHLPAYAIIEKGHRLEHIEYFFDKLRTGVMLPADSPIHILRNTLIKAKADKSKGESGRSANWMKNAFIVSWNKYIEGMPSKIIKIPESNKAIQIK